jgi:hypothetical protein
MGIRRRRLWLARKPRCVGPCQSVNEWKLNRKGGKDRKSVPMTPRVVRRILL